MKYLKVVVSLIFFCPIFHSLFAQEFKQAISESEVQYIREAFLTIHEKDQKYRGYLSAGTLEDQLIAQMDSVYEADGLEAFVEYKRSLKLSLPKAVKDSLWALQHVLDFQNHLMARGIWETYGFIPKSLVEEKNYVQTLLLLHPPKDWDVRRYQAQYAELLLPEVTAGRMPAKSFASFYDNMLCKILKEPQRYGTNQEFNAKLGKVLPPVIDNLAATNQARAEIGLPLLKEGEYRLAE